MESSESDSRSSLQRDESRTSLQRTLSDPVLCTSKSHIFEREAVEFSVKGPVSIKLDDEQVTQPGASLLDIIFNAPSEIGEIMFRNYYTAWLSVLVRYELQTSADAKTKDGSWTLAIPHKVLMPSPHREHGSQDCFSISVTESSIPWKNVMAVRLVLRQPSPLWRVFHVEELNVYTDIPRLSARPVVPNHLPHLHDIYYDRLKQLRFQTKSALYWNPTSKTEAGKFSPKRSPKRASPKKSPTKKAAPRKMTEIEKEIAAKVKAKMELHARYDKYFPKVKGRYVIDPVGTQTWFTVTIGKNEIRISTAEI